MDSYHDRFIDSTLISHSVIAASAQLCYITQGIRHVRCCLLCANTGIGEMSV
jgi:hypothetical protein